MFRFAMILAALALPILIADGAQARCVRGAAGCGAGYHGAGAGARGAPGHHHVGNRNGGANRIGRRR
jgi:hypothetical protein